VRQVPKDALRCRALAFVDTQIYLSADQIQDDRGQELASRLERGLGHPYNVGRISWSSKPRGQHFSGTDADLDQERVPERLRSPVHWVVQPQGCSQDVRQPTAVDGPTTMGRRTASIGESVLPAHLRLVL